MNEHYFVAISHSLEAFLVSHFAHTNMKLSASILLLVNSAFAVPGSFLHHSYLPVHGRDLLLRRQGQTPIVGNLTNEQAQAGYQAVCNTLNLDAITVTSEMNNVTQNAIAIQVFFFSSSRLQFLKTSLLFRPSSAILRPNSLSSTAKI